MFRLRSARTDIKVVGPERSAKRVIEGPALALALLLAACGPSEPTILDGSSAEAFAETARKARRELPDADRLDYDRALAGAPARRYSATDPDALRRTTFGGMTAAEVVDDYRERARAP